MNLSSYFHGFLWRNVTSSREPLRDWGRATCSLVPTPYPLSPSCFPLCVKKGMARMSYTEKKQSQGEAGQQHHCGRQIYKGIMILAAILFSVLFLIIPSERFAFFITAPLNWCFPWIVHFLPLNLCVLERVPTPKAQRRVDTWFSWSIGKVYWTLLLLQMNWDSVTYFCAATHYWGISTVEDKPSVSLLSDFISFSLWYA